MPTTAFVFSCSADLDLPSFAEIVSGGLVNVDASALAELDRSALLSEVRAQTERTYGHSTGLGPMVDRDVPVGVAVNLQYNLVRSHSAGMGEPLSPGLSRAILVARLRSLIGNRSAVSGALVQHIASLINAGISPYVPRKGGVGASGDLVQLAHAALLIIGEGRCWFEGEVRDAAEIHRKLGILPYRLRFRDGLALVNGTAAMVAAGAQACREARRLCDLAITLSCIIAELLDANREAYSHALNAVKRHDGQAQAAQRMRDYLGACHKPQAVAQLQAPYSVRCVPQIMGAVIDSLSYAEHVITDELNSVSDNPVFDPDTGAAFHGGNFHGESVAQAMDFLKIGVVKCSLLLERQLNLLLNDSINGVLPPFANLGRPGIELGLQGAQFTATSTAAENQTLAFPASIHSIPSNKDNQDVVSMGFTAAQLCLQTLDNAFDIAAVLVLALSRACAHKGIANFLPASRGILDTVAEIAPPSAHDRVLSEDLLAISRWLRATPL